MGTFMGRKRNSSWTQATAEQRVVAWIASGLSQAEFARRHGLSEKTLSNWNRRMRARGWTPEQSTARVPALLPVRVMGVSPSSAMSPIEVELRNGVVVRVRPDFDGPFLGRVLDAVSRC